jgi:hypothetical protein
MNAPHVPTIRPSQSPAGPATCGVAGHALVEARLSEIAALRDRPPPAGCPVPPPRFLRHCDEHTVVGIHAVLRAMAAHRSPRPSFDRHAVVAASCQAGRIMAAKSLAQLRMGGAVTVSTHIVPQASLHSLAGAVSVALGMHGPHIGTCGGPDALAEGLFSALSLAHAADTDGLPGIWLMITAWDEEPSLDATGSPCDDPVCRALAIALEPRSEAGVTLSLHFPADASGIDGPDADVGGQIRAFGQALEMCGAGGALVSWALSCPWGAEVRVNRARAATVALRDSRIYPLREAA